MLFHYAIIYLDQNGSGREITVPRRDDVVVSGRGFASRPGHTKDHPKNGTNCLPARHACVRV